MRIIDKIEKIGKDNVIKELKNLNIQEEAIKTILDFISIEGTTDEKLKSLQTLQIENELWNEGVTELTEVVKNIRLFGVPDENFKVDFTIARGLDYYTGTVYETFLNEYRSLGSVCSGGRYDNLAEFYTDRKLPGVGVSIGLTRLFYKLNEMNLMKVDRKSISDVLVISMLPDISESIKVATELRKAGINTEVYLNDKKVKAKFKYANKLNIPYVAIIGEEELQNQKVTIKDMESGEQEMLTLEEAIQKIRKVASPDVQIASQLHT